MKTRYDALDALEELATKVAPWNLCDAEATDEDGLWHLGRREDDGDLSAVVVVDTGNYYHPADAESIAKFYVAANGTAVLGLIADVRALAEALQGLDEAYCRAGADLDRDERNEDRQRLNAARAALSRIQEAK